MPRRANEPAGPAGTLSGRAEGPLRQCAVSRERRPQAEMIRFVADPDGVLVPDIAARLPGRGVWVSAGRDTLERAIATKAFARGLKGAVSVPEALADRVEALLLARCQGVLGMAKKAGAVVLGFDQVRASLRKARPGWLLEASDGGEDGRNKVYSLAEALYQDVRVAGALSAAELGMAFGRASVVHGRLQVGSFAEAWAVAYRRLIGFRPAPEDHWFSGRDR